MTVKFREKKSEKFSTFLGGRGGGNNKKCGNYRNDVRITLSSPLLKCKKLIFMLNILYLKIKIKKIVSESEINKIKYTFNKPKGLKVAKENQRSIGLMVDKLDGR